MPPGIHLAPMMEEEFVCLVREGHPRVKKKLDLETYATLPHVLIAPRGTPGGIVDEVLAKFGRTRRVGVSVPQFMLAPHLLVESDMVLTVGRHMAEAFARLLPLRVVEPPVTIPSFTIQLIWHERNHRDPAQAWFREQIIAAGAGALAKGFAKKVRYKTSR